MVNSRPSTPTKNTEGPERPKRPLPPPYPRASVNPALRRLGGSVQRTLKWRVPAPEADESAFQLRPFSAMPPRVLLIGSSTGGPQALTKLVSRLDAVTESAPILITQHMPATFTTILAEHLSRVGVKPVHEAIDGEPVLAGRIYLAPGIAGVAGTPGERPSTSLMNWALAFYSESNQSFPDLGGPDWKFGTWSPTLKTFKQAQVAWVDDEWDTMRSRGLRSTTRQTVHY